MKYDHTMELSEGSICVVSIMGYKPHEPTLNVFFPDALPIKSPLSTSYIKKSERTTALFTESDSRFNIVKEVNIRKAVPSYNGDYRRFCIDVASDDIVEARRVLTDITGKFELIEFDQRHIYSEDGIRLRMKSIMTLHDAGHF